MEGILPTDVGPQGLLSTKLKINFSPLLFFQNKKCLPKMEGILPTDVGPQGLEP